MLAAYLVPVSLIGAGQSIVGANSLDGARGLVGGALVGVVFGLMPALPYVGAAAAGWFVLHMMKLANPLTAIFTGAACGLACGFLVPPEEIWNNGGGPEHYQTARLLSRIILTALGSMTGWLVWKIAYRLATPQGSFFF